MVVMGTDVSALEREIMLGCNILKLKITTVLGYLV